MRRRGTQYAIIATILVIVAGIFGQVGRSMGSEPLHATPETDPSPVDTSHAPVPLSVGHADGGGVGGIQAASGPVAELPWQGDGRFAQASEQSGAKVLMAAYRTVLKDPLPGEEYNVHLAARFLSGTLVKPGEIFSQNRRVGPYSRARGFREGPTYSGANLIKTTGGGVCKIASTLYNVAVLANLPIVERRNHSMPVPYVPYGQDATVAEGVVDFRFRNDRSSPILIWAQGIDNTLYIAFYGAEKPPRVEWHHETLSVVKAPTVTKKNPNLPAGAKKLVAEGMDGKAVRSWVTIVQPDGSTTVKKMGVSYYRPFPNIVEVGS
ncbi:MAG: VanW family protein [Bacillota bacterium]